MARSNIENDVINEMSTQLANDIDREILWGWLVQLGWKRFMLDRLQDNKHAIDITFWLEDNCQGKFERNGREFIFEKEQDYLMFVLRWA